MLKGEGLPNNLEKQTMKIREFCKVKYLNLVFDNRLERNIDIQNQKPLLVLNRTKCYFV